MLGVSMQAIRGKTNIIAGPILIEPLYVFSFNVCAIQYLA